MSPLSKTTTKYEQNFFPVLRKMGKVLLENLKDIEKNIDMNHERSPTSVGK
jgi:hypothetical protein